MVNTYINCIFKGIWTVENVKKMEKKIGYGRGRCAQQKSCLRVKKNIPDKEIEKNLKTKEEDTPRLAVFVDEDDIEIIYLVGNGIVVNIGTKSVAYSLVVLTAAYYVFDLAFPREYEQFLEFIKHYIFMDEDKKKKKTAGFIDMLHQVSKQDI